MTTFTPWQIAKAGSTICATLHAPENHNVLTLTAIRALTVGLLDWFTDDRIDGVILRGGDNRVFSTGGDLVALYRARERGDRQFGADYFREEFQLDYLIATAPKPVMAIMNGVTLGGGAGIALHASIRVSSDCTLFAMPETGIGYFPDCGAGFFLNRCPGATGTYLGLTGQRIQAPDLCALGLATHYVPLSDIEKVTFETLPSLAGPTRPAPIEGKKAMIDRAFVAPDIAGIEAELRADNSPAAIQALAALQRQNPLSLAVALKQMQVMRNTGLVDVFTTEYRICQHFLDGKSFYEGIRAAVVDKDLKPNWESADAYGAPVDSYFAPHATISDWKPLPATP